MVTRQARLPVALLFVLFLAYAAELPAQEQQVQWERVGAPETNALDVRSLVVDSTGTLYAGTYGGGVWRSTDGDHWTAFNTGLTDHNITKMIVTPDGKTLFAITPAKASLFRCRLDAGDSWESIGDVLPQNYAIAGFAADSAGRIFVTNGRFGLDRLLYRSLDSGLSWITSYRFFIISSLFVTPADTLFAEYQELDQEGLERSLDGGQTWISCSIHTNEYLETASSMSFGVNVNTGSYFVGFGWVGCYPPSYTLNLIRSTDQGATWYALPKVGANVQDENSNDPYSYRYPATVSAIASRPMGDMFVGISGNILTYGSLGKWDGQGVWRSTDDGQSFTDVSFGLENKDVNALVAAPDGHIYAGTAAGIFRSTDIVPVELSEFCVE